MSVQTNWRVEPADPRHTTDEGLYAVARHRAAIFAERLPDDPPLQPGKLVIEMRHVHTDEEVRFFNAWEGERLVGHAGVYLPLLDNRHLAFAHLSVLPDRRRHGLASSLLHEATRFAAARDRTKLVGTTYDRSPSGEAFARSLGAQAALPTHTNQLDLASLDPALLDGWIDQAGQRAPEYRLQLHAGPYPPERLPEVADLWNVMNTAPRGDLDMEDWTVTPERVSEWQAQMLATDEQRQSAFVQHAPSGQLVGFSELFWTPGRETLLYQGATCVRPEHRRHGLGRWLKAANLRAALALNPRARFVRTGNADSNQGMLAINYALGFKPFMAQTDWQVPLEQVQAYLAGRA